MERERTCCFTGHRVLGGDFDRTLLRRCIEYLIGQGVDTFICGGALGFDTECAAEVIVAKQANPHIQLYIYAPCMDQDARWSYSDRSRYQKILEKADFVDMPSTPYYDGCMKDRNYKMVDHSAFCVCYLNNPRTGTGQTHRYAKSCGLTIYNLAGRK